MRIIVAGGRDFDDEEKFFNVMESELKEIRKHHDVIEIVSGHCSGADALGENELPIITVIFNNQVLGMVRQWQTAFYGKRFSQTDPHRKTNFVKLAEGFGLKGYHCENLAQFQEAFADALKQKGPTWIECMIDKDEKVLPMIPGGGDINDIIMK